MLLVLIAAVASLFEMAGAALVFVLVGLISDPNGDIDLPILGNVRELSPNIDDDAFLLRVVVLIGAFFLLRAVVQVGSHYVQRRVAENAGARLSARLVEGYLRSPYSMHLTRSSGELIRNSNHAVQQVVTQVFLPLIYVTAETLMTTGLLVVLVTIAPLATGLAVIVVGGASALLLLIVQPRLKSIGRASHRMQRQTLTALQEAFHGVRDVKILGQEMEFAKRYARIRLRLARANYRRGLWSQLPSTLIELSLLAFILIFFASSLLLELGAGGTLPILGLFAYVALRLQPSVQNIVKGLNDLRYAEAPLDDLVKDLEATGAHVVASEHVEPLPFENTILFQNIGFAYEGSERAALSDVDLQIQHGELIGICGPTGSGKTTFVDLMTGLLHPTTGCITVDGHDLRTDWRAWQMNLGVVPQMGFLIDDTLRRNIALGVSDSVVDDEAVLEAIELSQLTDFVSALPEGVETKVGERGVRISGGQRQRLMIARALYRRPSVLIFDEGTSALDTATETELMTAVRRLRGRHTIVLVAHRLSTVRASDRVIFIDKGRVAGIGTFDALAEQNDRFRALAEMS
jgi:ABC-type multidrug transport system fused ATPase/permease subunit